MYHTQNRAEVEKILRLAHLADEGGPLLRLLGQLGVELLHLHQSLHQHQRLCRLLQVLDVHLQGREARVPHLQLVPHALRSGGGGATHIRVGCGSDDREKQRVGGSIPAPCALWQDT